jgi:hypothetical protein
VPKSANLRDEAGQLRIDFIRTGLETSRTFASLAATEHNIGDLEAAEHCTGVSEDAYNTVVRFLSRVTSAEAKRRFETQLRQLRETRRDLHQRIGNIIKAPGHVVSAFFAWGIPSLLVYIPVGVPALFSGRCLTLWSART